MPRFKHYVGIDYSGANQPGRALPGIKVLESGRGNRPVPQLNLDRHREPRNWSRSALAAWLVELLASDQRVIVGIDHAFSLPRDQAATIESWDGFLEWFRRSWPTDQCSVHVATNRLPPPDATDFRLTEKWSSSARSIFYRGRYGVYKSTFAGIPWLHQIRSQVPRAFFWPFDGRMPPAGRSVVAEVYPAIFNRRYRGDPGYRELDAHSRDAYSVCRWLEQTDGRDLLEAYMSPPLTEPEWQIAHFEGWILGIR